MSSQPQVSTFKGVLIRRDTGFLRGSDGVLRMSLKLAFPLSSQVG